MAATADPTADLNATITAAVQARIEASVAEALAGGELIRGMVQAALNQTVEIPKENGGYGTQRVPFLRAALWKMIQEATKVALNAVMLEEQPRIEEEVRKRLKRDAPEFAKAMVGNLVEQAQRPYGLRVSVILPGE